MTTSPRILLASVLLVLLACPLRSRAADVAPSPVLLWPDAAPNATGSTNEDKPALYPYLAASAKNTGASIVVCPGGGLNHRCTDYEGVVIAQWFKSRGINAFVLRYRVRPVYQVADATLDGQRAIQYLRTHAADFHLDPNRIGIIGFSAGAELVQSTSLAPLPGSPDAKDPVDRVSSRPNFSVYCYGSNRVPLDGSNAPPSFMYGTEEDTGGLRGMLALYQSMVQARVPVEAHFFVSGEHGTGFAQGDPVLGEWPGLLYNWLRGHGLLTNQPHVALRGTVKIDGQPIPHGLLVLTPLDQPGAPPISTYVMNGNDMLGTFSVHANQVAVPGRYKVEVHQDAVVWVSQARDPALTGLRGATGADRERLLNEARNRNMEPSIEDQRVFRHIHPGDTRDYIVELKPGVENVLSIEVFSK